MYLALDCHYADDAVTAAGLGFHAASDPTPALRHVVRTPGPAAPYRPGHFKERELRYLEPLVREVIAGHGAPRAVVVDAYVWLGEGRPGLGHALHEALGALPVIGVAKTAFREAPAIPVLRGDSARPLWVTTVGYDAEEAAALLRAMHGTHRLPTLLKLVDRWARGLE